MSLSITKSAEDCKTLCKVVRNCSERDGKADGVGECCASKDNTSASFTEEMRAICEHMECIGGAGTENLVKVDCDASVVFCCAKLLGCINRIVKIGRRCGEGESDCGSCDVCGWDEHGLKPESHQVGE